MAIERHPLVVSRVVGDVLPPFTATVELRVFSENGRIIYNGSSLRPSQVASRPRIEIGDTDIGTFYTLVMVDADAPSPSNPQLKEYLHWLVTNIPGNTGLGFGNEVVSYESPRPSMGIHRLVLALFKQVGQLSTDPPNRRTNFNTIEFTRLHGLGSPVAAVYYNCNRENGTGGRRA
ncbi:Protein FLOWERING LOCUS T [Striga hermonthica]|uniref:Protein FLOWERING LOCUS T n=1 Tax=Striga hermonthica TaxID=68872 RepID=A0A9N7RJQ3_STRHE|nr:Protein FLOWERING LOCUS T [Striga hermonthica]